MRIEPWSPCLQSSVFVNQPYWFCNIMFQKCTQHVYSKSTYKSKFWHDFLFYFAQMKKIKFILERFICTNNKNQTLKSFQGKLIWNLYINNNSYNIFQEKLAFKSWFIFIPTYTYINPTTNLQIGLLKMNFNEFLNFGYEKHFIVVK